jgi:hypothetical protein
LQTICLGWPRTTTLPISTSRVARIAGMNHWCPVYLSILAIIYWAIWVLFRQALTIPVCSRVFPLFSCSSFKVSSLTLRSFVHDWRCNSGGGVPA